MHFPATYGPECPSEVVITAFSISLLFAGLIFYPLIWNHSILGWYQNGQDCANWSCSSPVHFGMVLIWAKSLFEYYSRSRYVLLLCIFRKYPSPMEGTSLRPPHPSGNSKLTCNQALPLSIITRGEKGLKLSLPLPSSPPPPPPKKKNIVLITD